MKEGMRELEVEVELRAEELDDIVSGHVGESNASTEQQLVKYLAVQTYH